MVAVRIVTTWCTRYRWSDTVPETCSATLRNRLVITIERTPADDDQAGDREHGRDADEEQIEPVEVGHYASTRQRAAPSLDERHAAAVRADRGPEPVDVESPGRRGQPQLRRDHVGIRVAHERR